MKLRRLPYFGDKRSNRAVAAVELALVLPFMLLLVAAVVEFGTILEVFAATNRLATQSALSWADCPETANNNCSGAMSNYTNSNTIKNLAPQLNLANLTMTIAEFTVQNGTATLLYANGYPSADSAQLATATATAQTAFVSTVAEAAQGVQYVVVVVATYHHTLLYFSTLIGPFLNQALTTTYTVFQLKS
jgi:Flp pilus assembly protein TadG